MQAFPARWWNWIGAHRLELALLLVFVAVGVQYSDKAMENRSAVLRWRDQVLDLDEGEDIYRSHVHPNPPITALMLRPLMELPPYPAAMLWFILKAGMAMLVIRWVFELIETPEQKYPPWAKGLAVLLSIRPIVGDLSHGNINLFVLFLVVAALHAYRLRRDWLGGSLLGLSIAAKVTPLLFVPYFLYKRSWKMLAGCAIGMVVFSWVVPGLLLGWEDSATLWNSWRKQMIDPFVMGGKVVYSDHHNQSLPGVAARLLTESPSFTFFTGVHQTGWWYHNLLTLHPRVADWLVVKPAMLLFVVAVMWCCRTPTPTRQGWRLAAEFSLVTLGMLIFNERTWKHHCVLLLLPFAVLAYHLAVYRTGTWLRGYLIASIAGALLLMSTTSTSLMGRELGKLGQVYGAYLWANLLLLAAMMVLLRRGMVASETEPQIRQEAAAIDFLPGLRACLPRRSDAATPNVMRYLARPGK